MAFNQRRRYLSGKTLSQGLLQSARNTIRALEVDDVQLISHDDKMVALTAYYTIILGSEVATTWSYDLEQLYTSAQRAEPAPFIALFSEQEALRAVRAVAVDNAPDPDGIGPRFYSAA